MSTYGQAYTYTHAHTHKHTQTHTPHFQGSDAVIFVVDSADAARIELARDELNSMLGHAELNNAQVLVFANKQDLPDEISVNDVAKGLGLNKLHNRSWHIQGRCSAPTGDGLFEGLDWLAASLKNSSRGLA